MFAIGGWSDGAEFAVTFKCSETSFAVLKDLPGLRPAPYLASRGLTWMQRTDRRTLGDAELQGLPAREATPSSSPALPRKMQRELGLEQQ